MNIGLDAKVMEMTMLNYMMTQRGKPQVSGSKPVEMPDVINLTIIFRLTTPTNKTLEFEPLKLNKGGVHNFTFYIGEDDSISGEGTFKLKIIFKLTVTTPNGKTVVDIDRTITVYFELPEKTVSIKR